MNKTVVLMKTHIWNQDIEKFAQKIKNETIPHNIDFFILMHDDNGTVLDKVLDVELKKTHILKFTETEIKSIYKVGFYGMWLSNHWITMWFYKKFGQKYKYFWTMEYDVRIIGDSSKIWKYTNIYDFLFPLGNYKNTNHVYNKCYVGGKLTDNDKYYGYLQLIRFSNRALDYLNKCFDSGENGQDEQIIFSLLNRSGLSMSRDFLSKLIIGTWTWQTRYAHRNKIIYERIEMNKQRLNGLVFIMHPIK